jgi:hypothetical protein
LSLDFVLRQADGKNRINALKSAIRNPHSEIKMLGYLFKIFKRLLLWGYARNTWQYDVLCACILAFIFLTPQRWFDSGTAMKNGSNGEPTSGQTHHSQVAS